MDNYLISPVPGLVASALVRTTQTAEPTTVALMPKRAVLWGRPGSYAEKSSLPCPTLRLHADQTGYKLPQLGGW